ncbi:SDR family NAD(P)-dependent oxidoreductase [uncultured Aurantimicrobium sp.]|uniref:SDR family NAD(P)-dependent oxidoreductase n=1 Tax=uncultured Aurantimicrobium sp. TaxID=1705357 RepID=UPI0026021889|nr:SDR family oxidoreductase [uncultured Aurantimicrobium sp.]
MSQSNQQAAPRTVLVTGAAGGMAAGINQKLIEQGHTVICADLIFEKVQAEAVRLKSLEGNAFPLELDVSKVDSIRSALQQLKDQSLNVDVIVNAAGILDRKSMADHDDESFQNVMLVNLVGPFNLIRLLSPGMVSRGWGRIINISSIAARNGYPFPSYAASKAGLSNLTRSLINDFWGTGVTVHNICPGLVNTPMADPRLIENAEKRIPTGAAVQPEEIGQAVVFLMQDAAASLNGSDFVMDGGVTSYFQLFER